MGGWDGGSDTRWRTLRAWVLRLHLPEAQRPRCAIGTPGVCTDRATQVDHIVPLEAGGEKYDVSNCRPACAPCNLARPRGRPAPEPPPRRVSKW
jgi:5-methylcytosine-specific restriction protein A